MYTHPGMLEWPPNTPAPFYTNIVKLTGEAGVPVAAEARKSAEQYGVIGYYDPPTDPAAPYYPPTTTGTNGYIAVIGDNGELTIFTDSDGQITYITI
jgi:hypothetical protein